MKAIVRIHDLLFQDHRVLVEALDIHLVGVIEEIVIYVTQKTIMIEKEIGIEIDEIEILVGKNRGDVIEIIRLVL